jgi:molybdopterin converting factor small subunit
MSSVEIGSGMSTDLEPTDSVRVLLFASYAEQVGREALELNVVPGTTVGAVVERVRAMAGEGSLPARPLCALNLAHVGPDTPVTPGDELAILPPLAGG